MRAMRRTMGFLTSGLAACALVLALGCAGSTRTETTVTRTTEPVEVASAGNEPVATTNTTTTTTTTSNEPDSVLGATVHAVGTVVMFPFRVVFDALGWLL